MGLIKSAGKMQKTVMVEITRRTRHPKYGKEMKLTTRLMAHDEADVLSAGDMVACTALSADDDQPVDLRAVGAD